jgi:poly-gamma-glutamate capsule biosynthesis protein CapA/YwtB (metallophosphatase superfamily)/LysM repeat protein
MFLPNKINKSIINSSNINYTNINNENDIEKLKQLKKDLIMKQVSNNENIKEKETSKDITTYIVKAGDTLWEISKKFNLTVNELKSLNNLTSDLIYVDQILNIIPIKTTTKSNSIPTIISTPTPIPSPTPNYTPELVQKDIILSFVGDCTIGTDTNFNYKNSFTEVFDKNNKDYSYFFKNVKPIFEKDDLTIVNLETTLTNATIKQKKKFNFKGDPSYVNILTSGNVEIVNLANNHTYDYLEQGFKDTINNLKEADIGLFGYDYYLIEEIDGIKIGFAGLKGFDDVNKIYPEIKKAMDYLIKQNTELQIISFHGGIEYMKWFTKEQQQLARYAIDNGADLIIGHHPHILQGIEKYKDKYIVYSLGNFVFGGNSNPSDKTSIIFQQIFNFENNNLINNYINIIPVLISSKDYINDYQPKILEGEEKQKVLTRINKYSYNYQYK